ncbi:MAG TPA: YtfJ family protein [Bacteroidales bacterium]|nr:YtfJ family protein [Bacteroidales bacterium]HOK74677.1 YtfJ family protein [Bacteroidales bacterium]HOM39652.1 YtfJ family protein [Bacteroidales bacterium]HOU30643.1 YtfJ family protein [Bacteroidales bacterium]HPP91600.1 YtfJ family protein [Bacteroidales bacterium]
MKRKIIVSLSIIIASLSLKGQAVNLEVGVKAPNFVLTDAQKKEFSLDSWPGKVLQINYVDPDEQDLNEPFNEAIDKAVDVDKRISRDHFKGFGIVDCKSTWKPNSLIRVIAGNKAKKYDTTILFDYDATLQKLWGLPRDSYSIIILDKNRVCRAIYRGKVPDNEIEKVIQLIIELTKE